MINTPITAIITPVFNDWDSLQNLITDIDANLDTVVPNVMVFVINDGSSLSFPGLHVPEAGLRVIKYMEILHLVRNVGHQRAIAIGLAYLAKNFQPERIIIMDADGEDSPCDLPRMIAEQNRTEKIVFAKRGQRQEGFLFKFYYGVYRLIFQLLTGKEINFGNFCVIPGKLLRHIVYLPDIWGHFASGVLRSGLPHQTIRIDRKKRYHGKTKMNFVGLVMHGLSAFSVYSDIMTVQLIIFTLLLIVAVIVGALFLLYVKYYTSLAIPGWATTVGLGLTIILMQSFLLLLSLIFNMLNSRTSQIYIPARYFEDYLLITEVIYG